MYAVQFRFLVLRRVRRSVPPDAKKTPTFLAYKIFIDP